MVAVLAVVAALAGTAVAGPDASNSAVSKKKVKKIATKQANKQIDARLPFGTDDIADGAVSSAKLAAGSVGTAKFAGSIPAVRATGSTNQSILSGTTTLLTFDSERYDTAAMHNNVTNNSRLTAPVDGIYAVTAQVDWAASGIGIRELFLDKDSDRIAVDDAVPTTVAFRREVSTQVRLQAGDFVQARVYQTSGGPLNVVKTNQYSPEFSMTWLAPGP